MAQPTQADEKARAIAEHMHAREGTSPAWGLKIEKVWEGGARVSMRLKDEMLNGYRNAHGGMIFALADTAFAYACNSRNQMTVAQQASISFLSPGAPGEKLTAEAREEGTAGRSGVYVVKVTGEDDRVVAMFQGLSRSLGRAVIEDDE
ncbi:MAG: hydroxyphenylacetyl-CoA thioesterase PaaI [Pseudomonadota bacterium]